VTGAPESLDSLDLVRGWFRAYNRSDLDAITALYHPACVVEHVFVDDPQVYEGRDVVRTRFANEFANFAGALAGGHRVDVRRVAGMEAGWGWTRAEWAGAVKATGEPAERFFSGYSDFLIDDGLIRRHRSVVQAAGRAHDRDAPVSSERRYPARPIVGVGAVILMPDDRVVLVKRRHEPLAGQWSLPGGMLELGETLEAGTAREVVEETGLIVDVGPVVEVFDRILVDEDGRVRYHFVLVDALCHPRGGALAAGTDVEDVLLAETASLARFRLTEKSVSVIERAVAMARRGELHPDRPL
jgi:8-oxo-dGTP diphosphatase